MESLTQHQTRDHSEGGEEERKEGEGEVEEEGRLPY